MKSDYIKRVAFIDIKNNKILLALNKNKDSWYIPGGKKEKGETDKETLIREMKEELAIDIVPNSVSFIITLEGQAHGKSKGTKVQIAFYTGKYTGKIRPSAEVKKADYFSYAEAPMSAETGKKMLNILKNRKLIT